MNVVEDQEDLRGVLRDLLAGSGYAVTEAGDGKAGVAKAQAERPDLILMDIQLPVIDGYEATRQIKSDPNLKATPVIAVSSYAMKGDEEKACASGCDHYVTKPYRPIQLLLDHPRVTWRTGVGRTSLVCGSVFGYPHRGTP
jgi:two-component system, cell cycle response regulator DivK